MRGAQEELYRYFYMDRKLSKLSSGGLHELEEVLEEIDVFLSQMPKTDLVVHSLITRLLELLQTARSFPLKHRTADLLRRHADIVLASPARDEVAPVLAKCLNGSDEFTRVVALRLVGNLPQLFSRDTAVYHTLLAKLGASWLSREERAGAVGSLAAVLSSSRQLGRLFGKHFAQLQQQYGFPLHVGLYLLTQVAADSHLQQLVLAQAAALLPPLPSAPQRKYFRKLVLLYARSNYRVLALCLGRWEQKVQGMKGMLEGIAAARFPFLERGSCCEWQALSLPALIDQLYSRKQEGVETHSLQPAIQTIMARSTSQNQRDAVLLVYFWNKSVDCFDREVGKLVRGVIEEGKGGKRLLKQLVVVGCYRHALQLLQHVPLRQDNYLLLRMYLSFKVSPSEDTLSQLQQVAQLLNPSLAQLARAWLQFYLLPSSTQANNSALQQQKGDFGCEYDLLKTAHEIWEREGATAAKQGCEHLLPSSAGAEPFWFAYLGKKAILKLSR